MLKILILAAVVGAFAFALSVVGLSAWQSLQQNQQANQETSTEKPAEKGSQTAPHVSSKEASDEAIARYTLWLTGFTGVLAFVALIQIGFLISADGTASRSANAAKTSADIAKQTLIATNRAWVSIEVSINGDLTWADDGTARVPLRFELKNLGKVPADIRIPITSAIHLQFGPVDPLKAHEELCRENFPYKGPFGITLFPDGTAAEGNSEMIRLDEIDFFKKRDGDKKFTPVIMGCVKYWFGLDDKTHTTPFIFHLARTDPNTDKLLGIVPDGTVVPKNRLLLVATFSPGLAD